VSVIGALECYSLVLNIMCVTSFVTSSTTVFEAANIRVRWVYDKIVSEILQRIKDQY